MKNVIFSIILFLLSSISLNSTNILSKKTYKIILKRIKRNELYYTQGIFFDTETTVIESGGLYGESVLVRMEYPSMKIIKKVKLDQKYFAEGIAKCGDYIYQLTWKNRQILKYTYPDLVLHETKNLDDQVKEGWGLTSDGKVLYATDGTSNIYTMDCKDLIVRNTVSVTHNNKPLDSLNALTIVNGIIYANKYFDDKIYKINPTDGKVLFVFEMKNLVDSEIQAKTLTTNKLMNGDVLNGITYNKINNNFVVTGKKWGFYYEVNLK